MKKYFYKLLQSYLDLFIRPEDSYLRIDTQNLAAVALLAISEILWLWQSWPVRQVLQPGSAVFSGLAL